LYSLPWSSFLNLYRFNHWPLPGVEAVGSKALALMRLFQGGYPVPDGFVLATSFFQPWLSHLEKATAWTEFLSGELHNLSGVCSKLQDIIADCRLSKTQQELLTRELNHWQHDGLLAIRSSSPEEDLENASFAGAYKTVLGVKASDIPLILPMVLASSLDYRVVLYKRNRGMNMTPPRLAVIIQKQIPSEVSGIGFSVNPVNGDSRQMIIESTLGLGTAVVEGRITPDHFIIEKATGRILESRSPNDSLTDDNVQALASFILKIEAESLRPIDIEWAMKDGEIFILQARPVTALGTKAT
jgi:phosphoenolpyruvate synthase/pyruvate phosphate dikinase